MQDKMCIRDRESPEPYPKYFRGDETAKHKGAPPGGRRSFVAEPSVPVLSLIHISRLAANILSISTLLKTHLKQLGPDVAEHPALFLRREGSGPPAQMGRDVYKRQDYVR